MGNTTRPSRALGPRLLWFSLGADRVNQEPVPAPNFVRFRHLGTQDTARIVLAATLPSSLAHSALGLLTDRHRLHWLVPAGMTTAGVGVAASGWAGSYPLTCTAVAVSGRGVIAFHPEAAKTARSASSGSYLAMSRFAVSGNLGFFTGPLLVTAIVDPLGIRESSLLAVPAVLTAAAILRRSSSGIRSGRIAPDGMSGRTDQWRPFAKLTAVVLARSVVSFGLAAFRIIRRVADRNRARHRGPDTGDALRRRRGWHSVRRRSGPGPQPWHSQRRNDRPRGQHGWPGHPALSSVATRTSLQPPLSTLLILPIGTLPLLYGVKDPLRPSDSQSAPKETP